MAGQGRRRSESRPALYGTAARPPAAAGQSRPCPLSDGTPPPGRWQPVPPAPPLGLSRARQLAARRQRRPTAVSRRRRQQQCVCVCGRKESVMPPTGRPRRVLSIQLMEASDVTDGGGGGAGHWRGPLVQGAVSGWVTLSWCRGHGRVTVRPRTDRPRPADRPRATSVTSYRPRRRER